MNDRPVQAGTISQSIVVTGDGNSVSLRFGDTGIVLPLKRKQFRPPERRRKPAPDERPRELDLPHIAALGSWLGTAGYALLKLAGIAP